MASIRHTKKEIKKHPAGVLWLSHAKHWAVDSVSPTNEYRGISRFFYLVDIKELSRLANVSEQSMKKYIIMT
jgi:hypothetical protein